MAARSQSRPIEDRNFTHLVAEIAWFGIALAATSRFLMVYAIRLEASPLAQGMIVALPGLILGLSTVSAGWWRNRFQRTETSITLPGIGFRFIFLLPALTPWFPPEFQVLWLVVAASLPAIPQGIVAPIFLMFMRESVGSERMNALNSQRFLWMNVGIAIGALGFGALLTLLPFPFNYQVMFVAAFAFSMVSQVLVMRSRTVYPTRVEVVEAHVKPVRLWKLPGWGSLMLAVLVTHLSFLAANAFIPLYLINRMGADEAFVGIFGMVELIGGVTGGLLAVRLIRRFGAKALTAVALAVTALAPLVVLLSTGLPLTLLAGFSTGVGWTLVAIGLLAMLNDRTPEEAMPRATRLYHQLVAVGIFVGPMVGGTLANGLIDLSTLLVLGIVLRVLGAVLISRK